MKHEISYYDTRFLRSTIFLGSKDGIHHRGYRTYADMKRGMKQLERRGCYAMPYIDTQASFALMVRP